MTKKEAIAGAYRARVQAEYRVAVALAGEATSKRVQDAYYELAEALALRLDADMMTNDPRPLQAPHSTEAEPQAPPVDPPAQLVGATKHTWEVIPDGWKTADLFQASKKERKRLVGACRRCTVCGCLSTVSYPYRFFAHGVTGSRTPICTKPPGV